jgi:hypothetical protein
MLVAEGITAGTTYTITLTYDCRVGPASGIDFLTDGGVDALLGAQTPPGPQRGVPDATAIIPDDPSISADDNAARGVSIWGGTFQATPQGPDPGTSCEDSKTVELRVRAVLNTLYVVWGAHLSQDAASGSSAAPAPIAAQARLGGGPVRSVQINPGAVAR